MPFFRSNARNPPPRSAGGRVRRLLMSYSVDWITTIALAVVFFLLGNIQGFKREFSLNDETLRFPFAVHERVPTWALAIISFVAPLLLQPVINLLLLRSWWDLHNSTLGLILSLSLAGSITNVVKVTVGRPRPDVIDRCQPPAGSQDPVFGLSSVAICTQTDMSLILDGWRSFPSGHSSLSFAGLGFLSLYVAGKLHLFDKRGHVGKAWIALAPLVGAALVAISRTMDYRHHWEDVVTGSALGYLCAYFSYRQYYPSLASVRSQLPYAPRGEVNDVEGVLPTHIPRHSYHDSQDQIEGVTSYSPVNHDTDLNVEEGTVPRQGPRNVVDSWKDGNGRPSR